MNRLPLGQVPTNLREQLSGGQMVGNRKKKNEVSFLVPSSVSEKLNTYNFLKIWSDWDPESLTTLWKKMPSFVFI